MKITMRVIKSHIIYTFKEDGKIVGYLGLYRTRENQLTAQMLLDELGK